MQTNKFNSLNTNPEKWSHTLKQIVGNLTTICLSVFDHFMNLALKGLRSYLPQICQYLLVKKILGKEDASNTNIQKL